MAVHERFKSPFITVLCGCHKNPVSDVTICSGLYLFIGVSSSFAQ